MLFAIKRHGVLERESLRSCWKAIDHSGYPLKAGHRYTTMVSGL
jgi:hypothetical protein